MGGDQSFGSPSCSPPCLPVIFSAFLESEWDEHLQQQLGLGGAHEHTPRRAPSSLQCLILVGFELEGAPVGLGVGPGLEGLLVNR